MAIDRRKLYESNTAGFRLILAYILLNVIYSIFNIKNMATGYNVGIFIMITIALLLLGFLTAVKVQNYAMVWGYIAVVLGVFQFVRMLTMNSFIEGTLASVMTLVLIISGIICILGGIVTIRNTLIRKRCVKEYNKNNTYRIK